MSAAQKSRDHSAARGIIIPWLEVAAKRGPCDGQSPVVATPDGQTPDSDWQNHKAVSQKAEGRLKSLLGYFSDKLREATNKVNQKVERALVTLADSPYPKQGEWKKRVTKWDDVRHSHK
jgi:hypothetical protein